MERDIPNLKTDNQTHDTALRDIEKWCTLVHHEIRYCGSFTPTLWAEVFQLEKECQVNLVFFFSFFAIKLLHEIVMLTNDIERFQTFVYKLYCVVVRRIENVKERHFTSMQPFSVSWCCRRPRLRTVHRATLRADAPTY